MESVRTQNKLKLLFEKLVEPNYVMNNYYADGLINKLSNCSDPDILEISKIPLISDLIVESLNHIDKMDNSVHVFLIRTLAIVAKKELHFTKMFTSQHDTILKGFKEMNSSNMNPSLKVAFMEVALRIVKHNSGINWLLETGVWKEVLSLCNQKQTVFVVRQTYQFAAEFLWRLNDLCDLANLKLVLSVILKPLEEDFLIKESMTSEEEEEICKNIDPMLHILTAVLATENRVGQYSLLLDTLIKDYKVTSHLYVIFDRLRKDSTCFLITKLMFTFVLSTTFLNKPAVPGVRYTMEDFLDLSVHYFNCIHNIIQRRNASLALDYCTACNKICWTICRDKEQIIWVTDDKPIVLANQMLFMCLVPLVMFVKMGQKDTNTLNKRVKEFVGKLLDSSCELTARAVYALRTLLEESDTMQLIVQSVKKLSCLKNYLNNEQANLVFQSLFYVLREYDPIDDYGVAKNEDGLLQYENDQDKVLVMTYVMDTVLSLLKHHNINWCESFEVICLYTVVYNILQRPNLTTKFVVASLNVIGMTIKLFLPPTLSLLLESKPGSAMDQLGKLIYRKLHDLSWEVRDSALELLLVCTEISFVKFPPFQKQILDNNLINVAAALAFNDYESYVQVSALKCLGAASKISVMWEQLKAERPTIQDQLICVLHNNQEGIVRKEACNVLCDIYQNIKLSQEYKQSLYDHMVSAAISDFHWEVQIAALKFWKIVFQSLLTGQGMLDGTFPPVTFSRESRKIVTLNEAEIQRRLVKILDQLSSMGFLTVLIKILNDDIEVEVLDCALSHSNEILEILHRYKVIECIKPKQGETETVEALMCHIKEETEHCEVDEDPSQEEIKADTVIEAILNADDLNLLASMYDTKMNLQQNNEEIPKPKIKLAKFASPHLFVTFLNNNDFKAIIADKRKWNDGIRSLSSLLDDVLGIYEVNDEVNSLDCY